MKNGSLARNAAAIHKPPAVEEKEIEILTREQTAQVLTKLNENWLFPIVSLALSTGMRRGELLGVQWGDIDLDAGTLRVERSLEETRAGLRLKSPKTKRGRRNITLPTEAVTALRTHKLKQLEIRMALGLGNITPETLAFSTLEGKPLSPRNVSRTWLRVCIAKKLPRIGFHAFRHTHASFLIAAGVDILTISRRLGHAKASITLDCYGHLIEGGDAAAAKAISEVLK
jgi:integrase